MKVDSVENNAVRVSVDRKWYSSFSTVKSVTALALHFLKRHTFVQLHSKKSNTRVHSKAKRHCTYSRYSRWTRNESSEICFHSWLPSLFISQNTTVSIEITLRLYKDTHRIWLSRGRIRRSSLGESSNNPIFFVSNTAHARHITQEEHGTCYSGVNHERQKYGNNMYCLPKLRQQVRKTSTHWFNALSKCGPNF